MRAVVLYFEILECSGTRVAEDLAGHGHRAVRLLRTLVLHDQERSIGHAIDGQVEPTAFVASRDREAAVIGANQMNLLAGITRQRQAVAFASVRRFVVN